MEGAEGFHFHTLEIRTLHIRDLDREKRVQAIGGFRDFDICRNCALMELDRKVSLGKSAGRKVLAFAAVMLAGVILAGVTFVCMKESRVFVLLGLAAVLCGVLGIVQTVADARKRKQELQGMSEEEAAWSAAWECVTESAPKKEGDNDLTYIPINKKTLERKNGDLMILYDLLPEIAVKAHGMIAEEAGKR